MSVVNDIHRESLSHSERGEYVDRLFGLNFPLQLEPYVFQTTSDLSPDYMGGYWALYALDNDAFYMAPDSDGSFTVQSPNGFQGTLSADALGIVACLFALSHLSFLAEKPIATTYARMYHRLREYVMEHEEAASIIAATD